MRALAIAGILFLALLAGAACGDGGAAIRDIAFVSNRDGNLEIYAVGAGGYNLANLSSSPYSDLAPAWSPDGKKIAFQSTRDGQSEVYVMQALSGG